MIIIVFSWKCPRAVPLARAHQNDVVRYKETRDVVFQIEYGHKCPRTQPGRVKGFFIPSLKGYKEGPMEGTLYPIPLYAREGPLTGSLL